MAATPRNGPTPSAANAQRHPTQLTTTGIIQIDATVRANRRKSESLALSRHTRAAKAQSLRWRIEPNRQ